SLTGTAAPALAREAVIETTIHELNAHPQLYLRKKVRVVAYIAIAPNLEALYESLDDFPARREFQLEDRPDVLAFRGVSDWRSDPYFTGRRAKVRVEGYFSDLCSPERSSLYTMGTCHDAPTNVILLETRLV